METHITRLSDTNNGYEGSVADNVIKNSSAWAQGLLKGVGSQVVTIGSSLITVIAAISIIFIVLGIIKNGRMLYKGEGEISKVKKTVIYLSLALVGCLVVISVSGYILATALASGNE